MGEAVNSSRLLNSTYRTGRSSSSPSGGKMLNNKALNRYVTDALKKQVTLGAFLAGLRLRGVEHPQTCYRRLQARRVLTEDRSRGVPRLRMLSHKPVDFDSLMS